MLCAGYTSLKNLGKGVPWAFYTGAPGCGPFKTLGPTTPKRDLVGWGLGALREMIVTTAGQ